MYIHRDDEKPDNTKIVYTQNNYKKIYRFPKSKYGREKSNQFPISSIDYTAREDTTNSIHTSKQIISQLYREAYKNNKFLIHRGKFAREFPQTVFYTFCNQKLSIVYTINKDQYSRNQTYLSDPKKDIEKTKQIDNNPACFVSLPPQPPKPEPPGYSNANYGHMASWNNLVGNLTSVGTNGRPSYYGTYDQSGNVWEWLNNPPSWLNEFNDDELVSLYINYYGVRGGAWSTSASEDCAYWVAGSAKNTESGDAIGFRIASSTNPLNLQMVDVGDTNNQANEYDGLGSVSYNYKIGKYTITNCEYVNFLNSIASTDTYQLYNTRMGTDPRGGITRSGTAGSYTYQAKQNMENKPVNYVSWFDAARYCNWLHNGKPNGLQNNLTTEDGSYTLSGLAPQNVTKNNNASYWIPTENEWYKAAYYAGGSTNAGYWYFATQSTDLRFVTADQYGNGIINNNINPVSDFTCFSTCPAPERIIKDSFLDTATNDNFTIAIDIQNNPDCCCNIQYSVDGVTWLQLPGDKVNCLSESNCLPAKLISGDIDKILDDDSLVLTIKPAHNANCCCSFIYSLDDTNEWFDVPEELIECDGSYYIPPSTYTLTGLNTLNIRDIIP